MEKPSISIIVPVYNVENYIFTCLKSITNQDYAGSIECILIDDCGNDQSIYIAETFIKQYNGKITFKIINHCQNKGLSAARNTGIKNATGEYLLFIDSDDEITPKAITSLTLPLQSGRFDFIIGDYKVVGSDRKFPALLLENNVFDNEIFTSFLQGKWYMMAVNKLVNRSFLLKNNLYFYEGIIHEDDLWSFNLAMKAKSMGVTTENCYIYKIREESITTTSNFERRYHSRLIIRENYYKLVNDNNINLFPILNNFLQSYDYGVLFECLKIDNELFKATYETIRQYQYSYYSIARVNGFNIRKQIRDIHLLFPRNIGRLIMKILFIIMYRG